MENPAEHQQKTKQPPPQRAVKESKTATEQDKSLMWDCGSSLYDSFELKSFEKQLNSAIHSRSLSMPHLSDRRVILDPKPPPTQPQPTSKKSSKISRSIHRLLRSVFKPKQQNSTTNDTTFLPGKEPARNGFYVVYDKSGVLSTIPEVPELDSLSPEIKSFVKRTASDRFTFTPIGISCA